MASLAARTRLPELGGVCCGCDGGGIGAQVWTVGHGNERAAGYADRLPAAGSRGEGGGENQDEPDVVSLERLMGHSAPALRPGRRTLAGRVGESRRRRRAVLDSCLIPVGFPSGSCGPFAYDPGWAIQNPCGGSGRRWILNALSGFSRVSTAIETRGRDPCSPGPAPRGSSLFSPERPRGNCCQDRVTIPWPAAGEPLTTGSAGCASPGHPIPGAELLTPRTESRRWLTPEPERRFGSREHFRRGVEKPLRRCVSAPDTECVVRLFPVFPAQKTGGSIPDPDR